MSLTVCVTDVLIKGVTWRRVITILTDEGLLEVTTFYGSNIMYNLKSSHVDMDNLQLKLNEMFMAGQNGIDKIWKNVMDELKKDIEREELYVKVRHGGIWLMRVSTPNVRLEEIPDAHEQVTTAIMRSLDQLVQGEPLDDNVVKVRDENGEFD